MKKGRRKGQEELGRERMKLIKLKQASNNRSKLFLNHSQPV
jgi:hypothetical protein